jgi:D-amino-acid dehydrogenase
VPIVGRWEDSNLFLNVGHGALGLTLAAGCATGLVRKILSLSVEGRSHQINGCAKVEHLT